MDDFHFSKRDYAFGDIISHCRDFFSTYFNNSSVKFIMRQTNKIAHNLAKVATSQISF